MNIKASFFLILLLFYSCHDIAETKKEKVLKNKNTSIYIDKRLESKILYFINQRISQGYDSNVVFTVEFSRKGNFKNPNANDSIILISTLDCIDIKGGYKGVLNIENFTVAFFDNTKFGNSFYKNDNLIKTPIDSLECLNEKHIYIATYILKKGEMKLFW